MHSAFQAPNLNAKLGTRLTLLDASEEPKSKTLRYTVSGVSLVILVSLSMWWFVFRLLPERRTAEHFMDAVVGR